YASLFRSRKFYQILRGSASLLPCALVHEEGEIESAGGLPVVGEHCRCFAAMLHPVIDDVIQAVPQHALTHQPLRDSITDDAGHIRVGETVEILAPCLFLFVPTLAQRFEGG